MADYGDGKALMVRHENSIVIEAPTEKVFAYVTDPSTMPDWMVGMIDTHNIVGAGEGQQYEWTYKMVGLHFRGQNVVVEYVPGKKATHQSIGMISSMWTASVEPHERGTKLTTEVEYTLPVAVLGKLAEHLTVRRNERNMRLALLNAKEILEA